MLDSETTMIAATLRSLLESGALSPTAMERATGIDRSSFYKWMDGHHDPGFTRILMLFRHCASRAVEAAILDLITAGTPWTCVPTEGDFDGDGDIDLADARQGAIAALKDLTAVLEHMQVGGDGVCEQKRQQVTSSASNAIRRIAGVRHAVDHVARKQSAVSHRRKAKNGRVM